MKKVYMPSMNELYKMQDMGANIYKYLFAKAVEAIVLQGINSEDKEILNNTYKYLRENPYMAYSICMMYPNEIKNSEIAMLETSLCLNLLEKRQSPVSNLDYLSYFDNSVLNNTMVLRTTISMLDDELKRNPKYRFEYKDNILLDRIINREITNHDTKFNRELLISLLNIEPAYGVIFSRSSFESCNLDKNGCVSVSVHDYAKRYYIPIDLGDEYFGKDILTNPDADVKRLIRCINRK
ncbi:MAG: hypothetical protein IJZ46_02950 [Bacilli bacterium]|nr:hypothetical protein [Bacilli bacterium]